MASLIFTFSLMFCMYSRTTENSFFRMQALQDMRIAMAKKLMYEQRSSLEKMLYQILMVSKRAKS